MRGGSRNAGKVLNALWQAHFLAFHARQTWVINSLLSKSFSIVENVPTAVSLPNVP
jgi:hypothetical protein